jgi:uncharacterized protein YecE (DUF72 family)
MEQKSGFRRFPGWPAGLRGGSRRVCRSNFAVASFLGEPKRLETYRLGRNSRPFLLNLGAYGGFALLGRAKQLLRPTASFLGLGPRHENPSNRSLIMSHFLATPKSPDRIAFDLELVPRTVAMKQGDIRIGISGWRYKGWRGVFYPEGLRQKDELAFAARAFRTIEINGTFYSLQRPEYFTAWRDATPKGFVFAVKGPRFITHMLKLTRCETPLANFFGNGVLALGEKLGPILWQFPPNFRFHPEKLSDFFAQLPRDTEAAAKMARKHDHRIKGRAWLRSDAKCPLRYAIEIRHESFRRPDFIALLRKHDVALVVADTVDWPLLFDVTADFVYCRLHGSEQLYASGYESDALGVWAKRVVSWSQGRELRDGECAHHLKARAAARDVFVYFDNDAKVRAPFDAQALEGIVGDVIEAPKPKRRRA